MKKFYSSLILVAALFAVLTPVIVALPVHGQINLPIQSPQQATTQQICPVGSTLNTCITAIFAIVFKVLIWVAGGLAVIFFIWAGIIFITKAGDPASQQKAKTMLIYGAIGLVVALVSYALVAALQNIVNVSGVGG
ncbi:MAG: hypothetical protein M1505_02185 [Patescibacteria group bacterium]|nr:hypothetical protein [Patescibacteria group bacterium]MCL5258010.1 hypothetical protein [Patescibacteria group bacterium]